MIKEYIQPQLDIDTQMTWAEVVVGALDATIEQYNDRLVKHNLRLEITWPALLMLKQTPTKHLEHYEISLIVHRSGEFSYTGSYVQNISFEGTIAPSEVVKKVKIALAKLLLKSKQ